MSKPTESKANPLLIVAAAMTVITGGLRMYARERDEAQREEAFRSAAEMNNLINSIPETMPPIDGPIEVDGLVETDIPVADLARSAGIPELGPEQSADVARQLYEQKCDAGEAEYCNSAARILDTGQAGHKDDKGARKLYRKGCTLGHALSCNNLGVSYLNRNNDKRDLKRAARYLKRACTPAATAGCANLAYLYENGLGVRADAKKAARLYARACKAGDQQACDKA